MADLAKKTTSPLDQMNFRVVMDGLDITFGVTAVRGIKKSVGNIEHRSSGTASLIKENHPGLITIEPITLTGGIIWTLQDYKKLSDWQTDRVMGGIGTTSGVDIMIHPQGENYISDVGSNSYLILKGCEPRDLSLTDFDTNSTGFSRFELIVRPKDIVIELKV